MVRTVIVVLAVLACGATARADGAFPGGQTILAPRDLTGEILIATNFGVVESRSAGRTWTWTCEQPANSYGRLYQMGPAPAHRLFAVAGSKLIYSDDRACNWQHGRRDAGRRIGPGRLRRSRTTGRTSWPSP